MNNVNPVWAIKHTATQTYVGGYNYEHNHSLSNCVFFNSDVDADDYIYDYLENVSEYEIEEIALIPMTLSDYRKYKISLALEEK